MKLIGKACRPDHVMRYGVNETALMKRAIMGWRRFWLGEDKVDWHWTVELYGKQGEFNADDVDSYEDVHTWWLYGYRRTWRDLV